ncbi:MAG TPA: RidA family protein [Actinomycetota bacterium]|nr:RidA family protein [Actinomycetota bacterium]
MSGPGAPPGPGRRGSQPPAGPHEIVNAGELAPPVGFAHAVMAAPGRTVFLGGQIGADRDGEVRVEGLADQLDLALGNLVTALGAAGGRPQHLVWMQIFVTDVAAYRSRRRRLGEVWRRHLGRHYVATALLEVKGLFDPAAMVEVMGIAVIPATVGASRPEDPEAGL